MGRMHTHRHGKSHSIRPATLRAPSWITLTPAEIEALVIKYAKDGLTPSQIGIKLRDQHSIPLIKPITKKSIGQILVISPHHQYLHDSFLLLFVLSNQTNQDTHHSKLVLLGEWCW